MEIRIVEYNDTYAAKVADMWNKSASSWGNDDTIKTEEEIIASAASSGDLKAYLAIVEDEVVGYCSFSEYRFDEGASYLPLLNVRPDFHGKQVGKKLILKVLKDAIKSKWPRFDLFTWSGNIKAVPLYKKCGFFWEKKNDSVHLMNFIPYVLKTEAVKDYFDVIDWYKDSTRPIELSTDGREEKGFEYYEYSWKKNNINLRMEFERKGRGLRLIETDDYLIRTSIDKQGLVLGYDYKIVYEIFNKSGKDLKVELKGLDDKNIRYNINESFEVTDSIVVEGDFHVGEVNKAQNMWKTHPTVGTNITINGKEALFKTGVEPKFPIKAKLTVPNYSNKLNVEYECYLDIENGFDQDVSISFEMPSNEFIIFDGTNKLELESKEKKSIPLTYKLKSFGLYEENIDFAIKINKNENNYSRKVQGIFRGKSGCYYGKIEEDYVIVNGEYVVIFDAFEKDILLVRETKTDINNALLPVKIGLPYSLEFNKLDPELVDCKVENDFVQMKLNFNSRDFKGLKLTLVCNLYANGVLETYYEILNSGEKRKNLKLNKSIYHRMWDTYIPYANEIVHIKGNDGSSMDYYDDKKLDENWIFHNNEEFTSGLCWSKKDKIKFDHWRLTIENDINELDSGEVFLSEPIYLSLGHKNYKDFRNFALGKYESGERKEVGIIDYVINEGNPFVKDEYNVLVKNNRKSSFEGKLVVNGVSKQIDVESNSVMIDIKTKSNTEKVKIDLELKDRIENKEFILYSTNNNDIKTDKEIVDEKTIYTVDNGVIKIKSSPEFSDTLFSIEYDGEEWLDSTFPTPSQKVWWNPWVGGINLRPYRMQDNAILLEEISCEFVEVKDNFDNIWSGLKNTVDIQKDENNKGIKIENYYLMLPGAKVLLTTSKIIQNSGAYLEKKVFTRNMGLNIDNEMAKSKYVIRRDNELIKYKCGDINVSVKEKGMLMCEGERKSKMIIYNSGDNYVYGESETNLNLVCSSNNLSIPSDSSKFTPHDFIIFSDEYLTKNEIVNFKNVKLK
ncbi:GNAT family N-acetyltransferase [Mycoplasmatota bacterium zrk1]